MKQIVITLDDQNKITMTGPFKEKKLCFQMIAQVIMFLASYEESPLVAVDGNPLPPSTDGN